MSKLILSSPLSRARVIVAFGRIEQTLEGFLSQFLAFPAEGRGGGEDFLRSLPPCHAISVIYDFSMDNAERSTSECIKPVNYIASARGGGDFLQDAHRASHMATLCAFHPLFPLPSCLRREAKRRGLNAAARRTRFAVSG
jgi:hypothetical protein